MIKERKLQIIKAADKRFSKHGLNKTTLDEIARDLRIGKATIYHYFISKEKLFYETIEWEASQIIEEIKSVFNNEQKEIKEKLIDYFELNETIPVKYKLVYEISHLLLQDCTFEREAKIINELIKKEEEILSLALGAIYAGRIETINAGLPSFFVLLSWGILFGNKLVQISNDDKKREAKEYYNKIIDNLFS